MRGTLKGKLTIVCDGNLIINGDIKMADQDSQLGIIALGNIYLLGKNDLSVEASLLSYKSIIYPDSLPSMWMKCLPYEEVNLVPKNNANLKIIGA
ncbi:MAG: hypothetical protein HYU63_02400, partial [Armatimonadetes bacterium]|nr:hypothetical protein [Armatimonadota bacterium]